MKSKRLETVPLMISEASLLEKLTQSKDVRLSERVKSDVGKAVSDIRRVADTRAVYRIYRVQNDNGHPVLSDGTVFKSRKIRSMLRSCGRVAVFLVTLGKEVDRLIRRNMKRRSHYAYILDIAASVAAESTAEFLENRIRSELDDGHDITLRYSPGYCDWPVEEQKKIFSLLPAESVDVALSEQCFMSPRKSISGIIGIGLKKQIRNQKNACIHCQETNCIFRRVHL